MTRLIKYLLKAFAVIFGILCVLTIVSIVEAGQITNSQTRKADYCVTFEEEDGDPKNKRCKTIKVTNGTLSDNGDGTFSLTTGAGGGGSSEWTDTGTILHPNESTVDEVVIGGTTEAGSDIFLGVDGAFVFNEQGNDADGRFEGDTETNLLFLDASTDRVGIGTNAPTTILDVDGSFRVGHSASADYFDITHNGTQTTMTTNDGPFYLRPEFGNIVLQDDAGGTVLRIADGGGAGANDFAGFYITLDDANPETSANSEFGMLSKGDIAETHFFIDDGSQNTFIFTNIANRSLDHDVPLAVNPTIKVYSDTSPDTNNTLWWSVTHDQTNATMNWGSGDLDLDGGTVNITGGNLTFGSDPADAGVLRLENNTSIGWEASPAGTDTTITVNASEQYVFSGLDCSGNANGGAITADATGILSCSDDDGGGGSGDITDVGNCATGAAFGGSCGTTLTSTTSEVLDMSGDAALTYTRNDAGSVTFSGADDAGAADTIYDTTGAGAITIGSADVTSVTVDTDGSGDAEFVVPANSIGGSDGGTGEITSNTIGGIDLNPTISMDSAMTWTSNQNSETHTFEITQLIDGDDHFFNLNATNTNSTGSNNYVLTIDSSDANVQPFLIEGQSAGEIQNEADAASNQVLILESGDRAAPADNDEGYLSFYNDDSAGTQVEFARLTWVADDVTNTTKDASLEIAVMNDNTLTDVLEITPAGDLDFLNAGGSLLIDANEYAFAYAPDPNFGLVFDATGSEYDFHGSSSNDIFTISTSSGAFRSFGSGTIDSGLIVGNATNGMTVSSAGVMTFDGTGVYSVRTSNYAFNAEADSDIGIYFNGAAGTNSFDFRGSTGVGAFSFEFDNVQLYTEGTAPTLSSCGTSPAINTNATNTNGIVTVGTGGPTACTISFVTAAWNEEPTCIITGDNTAVTYAITAKSTTAFTVSSSADMSSDEINYICMSNR